MKSLFSKLFGSNKSSKLQRFPAELSSQFELFQYLNFSLSDLQIIKLTLDSGQEVKAFEQFFHHIKTRHTSRSMWRKREAIVGMLENDYETFIPQLVEAGESILRHQFRLFAKHSIDTGSAVDWNTGYEGGQQGELPCWKPGTSYSLSQVLTDPKGDIRFVWNLNRHQQFLDLGKAYWYTGKEEFAREFIDEVTTWISQNPYHQSVNWLDTYEIALRGIFWVFGYLFFFSSECVDENFFCRFYHSLFLQAHTVHDLVQSSIKMLETHHLVASAVFLYLAGTVFPEYQHSKQFSKCGWDILQWSTNGLTLDQIVRESLASLVNSIELYCIVLLIRRIHRYHVPQPVTKGLVTMLHQMSLFVKPNGKLTRVGEHQPIQLLQGMYSQSEDFQYLFSLAAVLVNDVELKGLGHTFDESLIWFLGPEGYEAFKQFTARPLPQQSYLAPNRSYAVMRSGWEEESGYCIIANNPFRTQRGQRLKHSDLLSIEVYANGHELLIDAGPYSLQDTEEWNEYFCSVYAHNGLTVDRIKHLDFAERGVRGEFDRWVSTDSFDLLSGYHTGFEELEEPIRHRRSLFYWKPGYWIICDLLTGEGRHFFDQYFHFSPLRLHVDFAHKGVNVRLDSRRCFSLIPIVRDDLDVMIFTGGDTPDSGWISDGYKHRRQAPFIKYTKQARVPTGFYTLLYAYNADELYQIGGRQLRVSSDQGTPLLSEEVSAVEVSFTHETHQFILMHKSLQPIQFENVHFRGEMLFVRKAGERLLEVLLHNTTFLKIGDCIVFQCETPVEGFCIRIVDDVVHVSCSGTYTFRTQLSPIQELLVNDRRVFLKPDGDMVVVTTSRV